MSEISNIEKMRRDDEFSVPYCGRFKFRQLRHEKSGDVVLTGVGGKTGHSEWRSFKVSGPTEQAPAKIRLHRKRKLSR